jgi:hypothetical protein
MLALAVAVFLGFNIFQLSDGEAMQAKFDIRQWAQEVPRGTFSSKSL